MRMIVTLVATAVFGMGNAYPNDKCGGSDSRYYDEALVYHLSKKKIPYRTMRSGDGVCVDERFSKDFEAAQREVDSHFYQVAYRLSDSCEERAFVAWATKERLRFDVRPAFDSLKRPTGNMFLLRSFTAEEVTANMRRLEKDAPKGVSCPKVNQ